MKIPTSLWTATGPIPVAVVPKIAGENEEQWIMGQFHAPLRTIELRAGMDPRQSLATLGHEWVHVILHDSGLTNLLDPAKEEAICSAIGVALAASGMLGGKTRR